MDEFRDGECRWCGDVGPVYADNGLCELCDGRLVKCSICKTEEHEDHHCRHVFKDENFQWQGAGVGRPDEHIRQSFFCLLGQMPSGFAGVLARAIRSGRFHTWIVAPIIGPGAHLTLYGISDSTWADALLELGGDPDHAESAADGYRWLVSLYDRKTPEANKITLRWLRAHAKAVAA